MAEVTRFTATHVSLVAARAAELEQLGEVRGDSNALVRAARLYALAVRIADEIDHRPTRPLTRDDLAHVREELRVLASDAAAAGRQGEHRSITAADDSAGAMTGAFREIALRIEQRLAAAEVNAPTPPDAETRA